MVFTIKSTAAVVTAESYKAAQKIVHDLIFLYGDNDVEVADENGTDYDIGMEFTPNLECEAVQ